MCIRDSRACDEIRERVQDDGQRAEREGPHQARADRTSASDASSSSEGDGVERCGKSGGTFDRQERQLVLVEHAGVAQGRRNWTLRAYRATNSPRPILSRAPSRRDLLESLEERVPRLQAVRQSIEDRGLGGRHGLYLRRNRVAA